MSPEISNAVPISVCVSVSCPLDAIAIASVSLVCPMFEPLIIILSTVRLVRVPKDVTLGWAASTTKSIVPSESS